MRAQKRDYPELDVMYLFASYSAEDWNAMLNDCFNRNDLEKLGSARYGIQQGLASLSRQGMANEEITQRTLRLIHSLEKTAFAIIRKTIPLPKASEYPAAYSDAIEKRRSLRHSFIRRFRF